MATDTPLPTDTLDRTPTAPEPEGQHSSGKSEANRPTKKAKAERAPKPAKSGGIKTKTDSEPRQPRKKRGPARPHRRLDIDTINSRIAKLEKRRLRAKEQLEDATRHVEGYRAEREFRDQEAAAEAKE
jgi:hypothetical protein